MTPHASDVMEQGRGSSYRFSHLGSETARAYDRAFSANAHRRMLWELEQEVLDHILKLAQGTNSLTHLDFACGTGRILAYVKQRVAHSTGLDISPDMLALAHEKCPDAEVILGDITDDDILGTRTFDLVTAFRFFPNAEEELREKVLCNLVKHIAPGGLFVFNNHKHAGSLIYRLARLLRRGGYDGMSMAEAEKLIVSHGLELRTIYHVGFLPFTETFLPLPVGLTRALERMAMGIGLCTELSLDLIYVCTTRGPVA